jgi:outer membrane protein OmpA-like peptidoglycan-associated protein
MDKRNYDNALTRLNENKQKNYLKESNDILIKEFASALAELSMMGSDYNGRIISESEVRLIEENFLKKIRGWWGNLWNPEAKEAAETEISKLLPKEEQELLKGASAILAKKYGKECIDSNKADGYTGETLRLAVQNCLSGKIKGGLGEKLMKKFRTPISKTVFGATFLVLMLANISGLVGSGFDKTTKKIGEDPAKTEIRMDNNLNNALDDPLGDKYIDYAQDQGVVIKDKLPTHITIDYDTGSAKLNPDQQQKLDKTAQEILNNAQGRIDLGASPSDVLVKLNVQGNASNDGANWNHNNDTGGDNLNQDRANSLEKSLEPLVKQLEKMGVKVKVTKTIGEKGGSVNAGSDMSDATETGNVGVEIDSKIPQETKTDTTWKQGPTTNYVRDFPVGKVPAICKYIIPGTKKTMPLDPGNEIYLKGKLDKGEIQTAEGNIKFTGIILPDSSSEYGFRLRVLGGFKTDKNLKNNKLKPNTNYVVFEILEPSIEGEWLIMCNAEVPFEAEPGKEKPGKEEPGGKEKPGKEEPTPPISPDVPKDFLEGNRNMQLAYLAKNFLPGGKSLWDGLGIKEGSVLPSGFFDAALGGGKYDPKTYLKVYYNKLKEEQAFKNETSLKDFMKRVNRKENKSLIYWIRYTRKNIGTFFREFKKDYEELGLGDRSRAFVTKAGKRGKAMGTIGDSVEERVDIISESAFDKAKNAGFRKGLLMKNLPQFMEMLTTMYFGIKGEKIGYDKEAVINMCKNYGCKGMGGKKFDRKVSSDYYLMDDTNENNKLIEQIKRIKQLMK